MTLQQNCVEFLERYYKDEIAELSINDKTAVRVDHGDLFQYDQGLAEDLREAPDRVLEALEGAVREVERPVADTLGDISVRVVGLGEQDEIAPGEVRQEHGGKYVCIKGVLDRVTSTSDLPLQVAFKCPRCGAVQVVPQDVTNGELQEPTDCATCERQVAWQLLGGDDSTEWTDYAKLRIKSRPDVNPELEGKIPGYALNELIDVGGEAGLFGRAGEPVKVYGIIRRTQKSGRGENELLFDHLLDVRAIEFERDANTVDIEKHRDEFEALAARENAVDLFAESIAPQLHATDAWDAAFEFAVAYLFGAPRIDVPQGPTYRGDLHFLMITDFGMGKSTFKEDIAAYSPKCLSKSTTALSSGVGLTAAAVKDDFGEGQWTIKPGLLVRANGGHLILDEIDKGPDELTDMNDALEGEQVVDIEKAGQSATYESRTAVMALGNPVEGRFGDNTAIAEQMGINETLLSRFDGIVTMEDTADEEQDKKVAETYGRAYTEAQEQQYGDREEFDTLDRPVGVDVGQAWIKHAREEVNPLLRYVQFEELKDWYASEVRQLNHTYAEPGEGEDMPVPATVRVLGAAVKMSIAFARVRLQDEVEQEQIERAKKLGKRLVKQNWNGERFDATNTQMSQEKEHKRIYAALDEHGEQTPGELAENTNMEETRVRELLERARTGQYNFDIIAKQSGEYRLA